MKIYYSIVCLTYKNKIVIYIYFMKKIMLLFLFTFFF